MVSENGGKAKRVTLRDRLSALGVHNTHGLLMRFGGPRDVAVYYRGYDSVFRGPSGAFVYSPRFPTDPGAHWMADGKRTFNGRRKDAMEAAKEWAAGQYGVTEWLPDPTDTFGVVPAHVRKAAEAFVKESA